MEMNMAAKTVVEGSTVSASQLRDLFRQIADGGITGNHMQAFIEHRDPWAQKQITVTSDGRSGIEFVRDLNKLGRRVSEGAQAVLEKPEFVTTNGVEYKPVVVKGSMFEDYARTTDFITVRAIEMNLSIPPAELAPLLGEVLSASQITRMGYHTLLIMHEPVQNSRGSKEFFALSLFGLTTVPAPGPRDGWTRKMGFVFLSPLK
jgi:hypothetical protein